jgi:hypothetical protein
MDNDVFVEILVANKDQISDELFRAVLYQLSESIYDSKRNYIARVALGIEKEIQYERGDIIYVQFEQYRLKDNIFDINHCLDHGYAEKINGIAYLKARVLSQSKYGTVDMYYIGCDIDGNEIIQDDYIVTVDRSNKFILK